MERALISVSDKTGIVAFAAALCEMNLELLSTGGTARTLRDAGLPVTEVSDFTGFPEMLDGRVKTLHPAVHAGLLFRRGDRVHEAAMKTHDLKPIDLVCVNLYPFEQTVAQPGVTRDEAIEQIDIGGPTMIRSAAKNMKDVTVVVDPADYDRVIECMREHDGETTLELREQLGCKVFVRMAAYNAAIAQYVCKRLEDHAPDAPLVKAYASGEELRYGENPHQRALIYRDAETPEADIAHGTVLHGQPMSYNNYVDGDAALETVRELSETPAAAIIKHTNPCGCATGKTLQQAFEAAWAGDSVSAFGSVVAVSQTVDRPMAECLKGRFVDVLIAPGFAPDALEFLKKKSSKIRLITLSSPLTPAVPRREVRQINGGLLVQEADTAAPVNWDVPTKREFPAAKKELAAFGEKICKHVKSNAILLVWEYEPGVFAVLGMGAGQPNRVDSLRKLALTKARENIESMHAQSDGDESREDMERRILSETVLVSDAFFPFSDTVQYAAEAGIRYIVQPGGSKRDGESVAACDERGVAMALTGMRHFKH